MFSNSIAASIEVDAMPDVVWEVLTDFDAYPAWNPVMTRIDGRPQRGERLDVTFRRDERRTMILHPRVLVAEPGRELRWLGRLWLPWVFDGEHSFRIETIGSDRVRFTQSESFRGALVPFLRRMIEVDTVASFRAVNEGLAARVATLRAGRTA